MPDKKKDSKESLRLVVTGPKGEHYTTFPRRLWVPTLTGWTSRERTLKEVRRIAKWCRTKEAELSTKYYEALAAKKLAKEKVQAAKKK